MLDSCFDKINNFTRRLLMSHIANVRFTYRTPYGNRINFNRKIKVENRDTKSVIKWLQDNISGTDFVIHRLSWP